MRVLAVDPGAEHVGVSEWVGGLCITAYELTPVGFASGLASGLLEERDIIIAEDYRPQGGFGDGGAGMATLKLLGYLEWTVRMMEPRPEMRLVTRSGRHAALTRLRAAKYDFRGTGRGDHARDAEAVCVAGMGWSAVDVARRNGPRPKAAVR